MLEKCVVGSLRIAASIHAWHNHSKVGWATHVGKERLGGIHGQERSFLAKSAHCEA